MNGDRLLTLGASSIELPPPPCMSAQYDTVKAWHDACVACFAVLLAVEHGNRLATAAKLAATELNAAGRRPAP